MASTLAATLAPSSATVICSSRANLNRRIASETKTGFALGPKAANVFNLSASGLRPTKFTAGVFKAPNPGTRSAIARAAASTTVTSTDGDKLTNGTPAQAPKPVTLDDVSTQNPDAMLALAHDFAAADFSAVQTEVVPNLLGATSFDKWLGPVHVYGSYQITPPDLDVTIAVKLPFVGPVTIGGIHGTEGCVGKSGIVQACLSMKLDGLFATITALGGFSYSGYLFKWALAGHSSAHVAEAVPMMLTQPPTAFAEHLDVTLRNPATLEPTGTIFTKHTFDDGQAIPAHSHMGDTVSVVISGEVAWTLSTGETIVAKPGQVVQIPGHEVYSLKANGKSQILTTCIFYW